MHRRSLAFVGVAAVLAVGLWLSANYAVNSVKLSWNEHRLEELVDNLIRRAEFAIDNVIIAKVDLLSAGHNTCDADSIAAVREAIYRHGALVDMQIRTPEGTCQAFEGIGLDGAAIAAGTERALGARNADFRLMQLADETSLGLGIVWEFRQDHRLTAVIRTDALLFDMLPSAIRDEAAIALSLVDGSVIARYQRDHSIDPIVPDGDVRTFSAGSDRYPIVAEISLPDAAFIGWQDQTSPVLYAVIALMSLLLGLLAARGLVRAPSERELLRDGLRSGEIVPYFQPIVSLATNRIVGCEVLARWIKPDGTHVPPSIFIPLAELTDQSETMTHALMRDTGRDLGAVLAHRPDFKVNFNVTAKQLEDPGYAATFIAHVDRSGLPKSQVIVELIEREALDSLDSARSVLAELQSNGIRVAIDDIGTGQNGLALLQSLGADIVKIDKLFIDLIDQDSRSRNITEMLVGVARASGMTIVAEGVERPEQVATLLSLGVNEAQGFYFAQPLPAAGLLDLLKTETKPGSEQGLEADASGKLSDQTDDAQKAA